MILSNEKNEQSTVLQRLRYNARRFQFRMEGSVYKIRSLSVFIFICSGLATSAGPVENAIVERIARVGYVCVEGTGCVLGTGDENLVSIEATEPESNYNMTCATCHNIGVAGAPKLGDAVQWAPRVAKGMDVLYASSIDGMPPGMPAKGMCFNCSDDDLMAIVDYMVEASK